MSKFDRQFDTKVLAGSIDQFPITELVKRWTLPREQTVVEGLNVRKRELFSRLGGKSD